MYCELIDLKSQMSDQDISQLTDDSTSETLQDDIAELAITDAMAEIDSYCYGKYSVPFDPVPAMVKKLCVDIAIYNLFSRRESVSEIRETRYKNAIDFLNKVASGELLLGASGLDSSSQLSSIESGARVFTRTTMSGY